MLTSCLFLLMAYGPETAAPQDLPPYFISIIQDRTLFAKNEAAMITLRVGNQIEGVIKAKKLPRILEALQVYQGDTPLARNPKFKTKDLYKKVNNIGYGAHKDFRLNLRKYFPDVRKGGIFKIVYKDDNYEVKGKNISVVNMPMPDLKVDYLMRTSMGDITIRLDPVQTPSHARNFALLVATQFYRDMIFHRVERNYVIQTGDPIGDGTGGSGFPVGLEKSPFLRHKKYAVGMARKADPNSGDSQFYICLEDVKALDDSYTAFGKVVAGFDVVDRIGVVPTTPPGAEPPSRPLDEVRLVSITAVPQGE